MIELTAAETAYVEKLRKGSGRIKWFRWLYVIWVLLVSLGVYAMLSRASDYGWEVVVQLVAPLYVLALIRAVLITMQLFSGVQLHELILKLIDAANKQPEPAPTSPQPADDDF
jgi:hypothetical protein